MNKLSYRALIPAFFLLAACSPAATPNPAPTASTAPSGSPSNTAINGCTSYVDRTDVNADRDISWDFGVANSPERCMKIKVGQTVTFRGDFKAHPLKGQNGGDNNPFGEAFDRIANPGVPDQEFTPMEFPSAGTFGFTCSLHPNMMGAIQVVP